jgi:hypothetical protein
VAAGSVVRGRVVPVAVLRAGARVGLRGLVCVVDGCPWPRDRVAAGIVACGTAG